MEAGDHERSDREPQGHDDELLRLHKYPYTVHHKCRELDVRRSGVQED